MKQIRISGGIIAATAFASSVFAQSANQVLFDFGRHDNVNGIAVTSPVTPEGGSGAYYWNAIGSVDQAQADTDSYTDFVTTDNSVLLGWSIDIGSGFQANGLNNGGLDADATNFAGEDPLGANLGDIAVPDATGDYFFTTGTGSFILQGLNPALGYDFTFFGSRNGTGDRFTTYSATGLGGTSTTSPLQTTGYDTGYTGNNANTVSLSGIVPTVGGEITISADVQSGGFAYLNTLEITVIPEPSTAALSLVCLLGLTRLTRRWMRRP